MTKKYFHKIILMLSVVVLAGFGSNALAHMEQGSSYKHGWHHGSGGYHHGCGGFGDYMSEEQITQMQAEHKAFFEATREIRQQVYQKRLELRSEIAKKEPDSEKSLRLQKEISELQAQLGLKRLEHVLKMKQINPDVGRGLRGPGWGGCGMMGPGYQMGSGMMMGPGMMGGGMMRPGDCGEGDTRQYHMMQSSPAE